MWWLTVMFDSDFDFSQLRPTVKYQYSTLLIRNGSENAPHNIAVKTNKRNVGKTFQKVMNLFSELAWLYEYQFYNIDYAESNCGVPMTTKDRIYRRYLPSFDIMTFEKLILNDTQRLALSLYREAISSNSVFYEFLGYFKIINILFFKSESQINWLDRNANNVIENYNLSNPGPYKFKFNEDIGKHLFDSGRCAVAHASCSSKKVIANPDSFNDFVRISKEKEIMKAFARYFIESELGVRS